MDSMFWQVEGEAITNLGKVEFLVVKDKNKLVCANSLAPKHMLQDKELLANYPKGCQHCGFSKFYGVRAEMFSVGYSLTYFCPKCRKDIKELEDNW